MQTKYTLCCDLQPHTHVNTHIMCIHTGRILTTSERITEHTICTSDTMLVSVVNMCKKNNDQMCS